MSRRLRFYNIVLKRLDPGNLCQTLADLWEGPGKERQPLWGAVGVPGTEDTDP